MRVSNGVIFWRTAKGGVSAIEGMGMGGCREMEEDRRLAALWDVGYSERRELGSRRVAVGGETRK